MGIASSASMAFSEEGEESRTLIEEDSNETNQKEEEVEEECPLCKFIKNGECKESWIAVEKCADEAGEESDATRCKEVRLRFKTCMFENPDYYEPLISFQAQVVAGMISELQAEKEAILAGDAAAIAKALSKLQTDEQPVLPAEAAAIAKAFQELEADKKKKEEKAEVFKGNE